MNINFYHHWIYFRIKVERDRVTEISLLIVANYSFESKWMSAKETEWKIDWESLKIMNIDPLKWDGDSKHFSHILYESFVRTFWTRINKQMQTKKKQRLEKKIKTISVCEFICIEFWHLALFFSAPLALLHLKYFLWDYRTFTFKRPLIKSQQMFPLIFHSFFPLPIQIKTNRV